MELIQISKSNFREFVAQMLAEAKQEIIGVVKKGKHFAFDTLEKADEMCLDYDVTILPPKKYFLPVQETILKYQTKDAASYEEVYDETSRVIIGIHPGDLAAIALLDKAFSEGESDGHYLRRRQNSVLVGIYPTMLYKYRFSSSMIKEDAYKAADCMLIDLGDEHYGVEIVTAKGQKLLSSCGKAANAEALAEKIAQGKQQIKDELTMPIDRDQLPQFLNQKQRHQEWKKRAQKCFSCGSCVLVCPTCYCFDVKDEVELSLQKGERVRSWDGCMLSKFATVAGNHNFRRLAADRLQHRLQRKGNYLLERFGLAGCVGCGRCAQACVADIASPIEIVTELMK